MMDAAITTRPEGIRKMPTTLVFPTFFSPYTGVEDPGLDATVRFLDRWQMKKNLYFFLHRDGCPDGGSGNFLEGIKIF